jgi:N-acetylglucosamine malate deacetylase 2
MGDWRTELTGRVLVLVAHADDECVGYGALLQKMRAPVLVIATDGAPRDRYFWGRYGSREAYAAVRREEARRAAQVAGLYPGMATADALVSPVRELVLLAEADARLEDQRLFLNLAAAYEQLIELAERTRPEAIATLAYEGGHPDHDSCSVLGARLGERLQVPVWEAPLYHRAGRQAADADRDRSSPTLAAQKRRVEGRAPANAPAEGGTPGEDGARSATAIREPEMRVQEFLCENGSEAQVEITAAELERKQAMCAAYASQGEILRVFDARREGVRPQARYDYARRPHAGPLNYECWQWWMRPDEVSAKFAEFLESAR